MDDSMSQALCFLLACAGKQAKTLIARAQNPPLAKDCKRLEKRWGDGNGVPAKHPLGWLNAGKLH